MRRLLLILLGVFWAVPAWAAVPTVGSTNYTVSTASFTGIHLTNVDAGAAVVVLVVSGSSNNRTYTMFDNGGNTYTTVQTGTGCGVNRCAMLWADYAVSASADLTITIEQSSTHQAYHVFAIEINCPTACAADTSSSFYNSTSGTTWFASADATVIDTTTDVFLVSGCGFSTNPGTITHKSGWTAFTEPTPNTGAEAQYRSSTGALTDERGELVGTNAPLAPCAMISVKEVAGGGGGGAPSKSLLLGGVGVW